MPPIHLTGALTNGDIPAAKFAANAIAAGAGEVTGGAATGTTAAIGIEIQRKIYATLSKGFIALVKRSGLNSGGLYVDFCPMALNDQGAFGLSRDKEIKNPYFGEKMMSCGKVPEVMQ